MNKGIEKHLLYIVFVAYILVQVFVLLFSTSETGFGGFDNISHYQLAKYSFNSPELLLDLRGKPVYTTLLTPFTLFGFNGAKAFNIIVAVLALLVSVRISKRLFPGSAIFTVVLIGFAPMCFLLAVSCLSELLFALTLLISILLFIQKRYIFSALVLSFIPFVGSVGFVLFPIFIAAYLLQRSYLSILFLVVGAAFYSIIGYFVFDDFLWFVNQQSNSIGVSGGLFDFIRKSNFIFGVPLLVLIIVGLPVWVYDIVRKKTFRSEEFILFVLIVGSWTTYFAAQSYVWWKGIGGSLGLIQVMGGVLPLAALTGMKAFEFATEKIKNRKIVYSVFSLLALMQVVLLFTQNKVITKPDYAEQLLRKSSDYVRLNESEKKVYYFDPLITHFLELDPYDSNQYYWWTENKAQPSNAINWGDLILWDAHFGPNEGGIQLDVLENDPNLRKVKSFYPKERIAVKGGNDYSIQIFEKSMEKEEGDSIFEYEKELVFSNADNKQIVDFNGTKCWELDKSQDYSPNLVIGIEGLDQKNVFEIDITVNYLAKEKLLDKDVVMVLTIENEGQHIHYETVNLPDSGDGSWKNAEINTKFLKNLPSTGTIKIYVWNIKRKNILIENIQANIKCY